MKESLKIDGRIYISSRRAAEISKYSNDYIGQLCRGRKVASRMMGRTWFVDQQSLLDHKKASEEAFEARCKMASREHKSLGLPTRTAYVGQNSFLSRNLVAMILVLVILATGGFLYYGQLSSQGSFASDASALGSHQLASPLAAVLDRVGATFRDGYQSVVAYVSDLRAKKNHVARSTSSSVDGNDQTAAADVPWNGMAVMPSSPDSDAESERRIRESFSDPVEITPDESGTAGVIKPVFREANGDDFLYVLVPVKEEKK